MTSVGSLIRLEGLVAPPDYPVGGDGDWKRFWSVNGFKPPEDYTMLIREYGVGTFAGWLRIIEPFDHTRPFVDLADAMTRRLPPSPGQSVWPDPGGFLPWAQTVTGDFVGWRTNGRPNNWTIVYWDRQGTCTDFDTDAIGFLVAVAAGDITVDGGNPFSKGRKAFEPIEE